MPKAPEVLLTTAATGDGVPELLAALDRHRDAGSGGPTSGARLARAEAQVRAILAERVRDALETPARRTATAAVIAAVADHSLDPYAAADRLLEDLLRADG
jgi:LAO/AO transport system kinase